MQNLFIRPTITRQPNQATGINLSHPLAKDLAMFINPGAGAYDQRGRRSGAFNGTFRRANQRGMGIMATANSSVGCAFSASPMKTSSANGLGDFTYLVIAAPIASTTREFFAVSQNGATEFYFGANFNVGLTATSGMLSAQTNSGGASGVQVASVIDGKPHVFAYSRKINGASGDGALYMDGVLLASNVVNMVQMWSSASTDYVAGYSGAGWGVSGPVSLVIGWNRALSAAEVAQISANPYQLFASPAMSFADVAAGGTDTPVNPGTGAITIAGFAPAVAQTANQAIVPGAGSVAIAGYAPAIAQTANQAISPDNGAITITGYAPTVEQASPSPTIEPSTGALTIVGYAPAVSQTGQQASGGFFEIPQVRRHRSIKEDRERLGIIPREVKQIVKAVARATVVAEKTDTQAEADLARRLKQQDIEAKAKYAEFMRQERDRLRTQEIARAIQIQRRKRQLEDEEDDRDAVMLLMS